MKKLAQSRTLQRHSSTAKKVSKLLAPTLKKLKINKPLPITLFLFLLRSSRNYVNTLCITYFYTCHIFLIHALHIYCSA
jgi:hypothetical protein